MARKVILFGSGGHAKVVIEALRAADPDASLTVLVDDPLAAGRPFMGQIIAGGRDWLAGNWPDADVVPALGNNGIRAALIEDLLKRGRRLATIVHPRATISPSASIAGGCFVAAGAVINAEADLSEGVIVNTCASVDHDCRIGASAHIAPGARLCGTVEVGAGALVGAGSAVIPGRRIGRNAIVGAGSTVVNDIPDDEVWGGSPARPLRAD